MESLRKLKDSIIAAPAEQSYPLYIIRRLQEVVQDLPNDAELGREIRIIANMAKKRHKT